MKKGFIAMLALTVFLALGLGFGETADAKRGGGFKSNKQSFTQNKDNTTQQSNSGAATGTSGTKANTGTGSAATTKSGGLFGGNSLMKGLMIGGLAGMLFGGMFANMGAFGEILGLLINIAAIFAIFMIIRVAWVYIRNNKKPAAAGHNQSRSNHYYDQERNRDEEDRNGRG